MRAPELVTHQGFLAYGLTARTSNEIELEPRTARIPLIWRQFYEDAVPARLSANALNGPVVGVYSNYENGVRGQYSVTAAVQIQKRDMAANGLDQVSVSSGEYVRFQAYGMGPEAVQSAWAEVWDFFKQEQHALARNYERAFTADFERYGDPEAMSIFVAVKRKLGVTTIQSLT